MKVRLIKLLEEVRDAGIPPLRRAPLKPAMLYLMEIRSHTAEPRFASQKHVIPVELLDDSEIPEPVTITHLAPQEATPELAVSQ
jgi:hypothetical protein